MARQHSGARYLRDEGKAAGRERGRELGREEGAARACVGVWGLLRPFSKRGGLDSPGSALWVQPRHGQLARVEEHGQPKVDALDGSGLVLR